jgi:hypothetical protein
MRRIRTWVLVGVACWLGVDAHGIGAAGAQPSPGVRNAHGLAFDGRVSVLFGGANEREVLADTWAWDGRVWQRLAAVGPEGRTFPVMVAAHTEGVYLFGGRRVLFGPDLHAAQFLSDLWLWRGQRWTRVPATGPDARAEAAGAWDPRRRRLVVFGGYRARDGVLDTLGDTWEFGDGEWHQAAVHGPSPRHGAVAVFDDDIGEVVLFGGNGASGDTWAWNGSRWRRLEAGTVPGRYNAASSAGAPGLPTLRFGGWDGERRQRDAWTLRTGRWQRALSSGPSPSPRNHAAMTYDAARGRYVLVGGHEGRRVFGDVWEADALGWRRVFSTSARSRVDNLH